MRKWMVIGVVMACVCATLPRSEGATFSWRFIGLNALREKKDLVAFQEVSGLPEFHGFRSGLAARVAATLASTLAKGGNEGEIARLLHPIAVDLADFPTVYEHQTQGASNLWSLAIQLPGERHGIWASNWEAILKAGHAGGAKIAREGAWTILGNGPSAGVLEKTKKAADDVLQINGDATMLDKLLPGLKPATANVRVSVQGKALRTEGKMQFEQDLPFKLSKWEIPMNTITEPLAGFTAVQGLEAHLAHFPAFKHHKAPNQLFIWSENMTFFSIYAAAKVDNARAFLMDLTKDIDFKSMTNLQGSFEFNTNSFGLYLTGLPIAVPFVRGAHPSDTNFVQLGLLPVSTFSTNAMPAELAAEVTTRTNLVYYDWELAAVRLGQYRPIRQMIAMAQQKDLPSFDGPAHKWLTAAESKLGNNVTEITKTGSKELTFIRRSDLGLSALELFELTQWIAGPPVAKPGRAGAKSSPLLPLGPKPLTPP